MTASLGFGAALASGPAELVRSDGGAAVLAVGRWRGPAAGADRWLLDRCHGPALDLGCGPGRLVVALCRRGIRALGVDESATAVAQCRRRGAPVVHGDLFGPLPDEGGWRHVLLADGNLGIGGEPLRLLRRARELVSPGGTVLVETDPQADACWSGTVRVRTRHGLGEPIPWAAVGVAALPGLARAAGLEPACVRRGARSFAELRRPDPPATAPG